MRKFSWMVALIAISALVFAGFASCGGDDDGEKDPGQNSDPTVVNIAAITGVTAPVTGATAVTSVTSAQYTGTITWANEDGAYATAFTGGKVYTATITLTAAEGFTLTGVGANFFTVAGATATNPANSGVVTAVFPATEIPYDPVIYDMQNDPDLASFSNGTAGGNHTNGLFSWSLSSGGSTTVDETAKTVTTSGKGGTGQGIRLIIAPFLEIAEAGYSYTFEYSGVFLDDAGGFGRLRLEGSTGAVLATGTEYNTTTREFSLTHTMTTEELAAVTGSTHFSFGNTGSGNTNITYTKIKITEIPPAQ